MQVFTLGLFGCSTPEIVKRDLQEARFTDFIEDAAYHWAFSYAIIYFDPLTLGSFEIGEEFACILGRSAFIL